MNRAEKKAAAVSSEREFREAFVGADYDDASALLNARPREKRDKKMTEQEVAAARAGGLMASLGADAYPRADVESYEADLAAGRAFASPEEEAQAKAAQAKARYEAEAARLDALERALNEDGSIQWDAPRDVREVLEALLATENGGVVSKRRFDSRKTSPEGPEGRPRPSSRPRAVNPDGSVPWDAPEVPTYVFNEELRSRLGVEEGAESALAWDEKPEAELVSSFRQRRRRRRRRPAGLGRGRGRVDRRVRRRRRRRRRRAGRGAPSGGGVRPGAVGPLPGRLAAPLGRVAGERRRLWG